MVLLLRSYLALHDNAYIHDDKEMNFYKIDTVKSANNSLCWLAIYTIVDVCAENKT